MDKKIESPFEYNIGDCLLTDTSIYKIFGATHWGVVSYVSGDVVKVAHYVKANGWHVTFKQTSIEEFLHGRSFLINRRYDPKYMRSKSEILKAIKLLENTQTIYGPLNNNCELIVLNCVLRDPNVENQAYKFKLGSCKYYEAKENKKIAVHACVEAKYVDTIIYSNHKINISNAPCEFWGFMFSFGIDVLIYKLLGV